MKLTDKIIDVILWLQRPWTRRKAAIWLDILHAIWDVRWDAQGIQYWEISTGQLWSKVEERYLLGTLYVRLDELEKMGLLESRYELAEGRAERHARILHLTSKAINHMVTGIDPSFDFLIGKIR